MSDAEKETGFAVTITANPFNLNFHTHEDTDDDAIATLRPLQSAQEICEKQFRKVVVETAQSGRFHEPSMIQKLIDAYKALESAESAVQEREKDIDAERERRRIKPLTEKSKRKQILELITETAKYLVDNTTHIFLDAVNEGNKWYATAYAGDSPDGGKVLGTTRVPVIAY